MARLKQLDPDSAKSWTKKLLRKVEEGLGVVPNMFKAMGNSPMTLEGFLTLNGNLNQGNLDGKLRKMIILASSEINKCGYCVAAHTQMAKDAGVLTDEECLKARRLEGIDEKSKVVLGFVKELVEKRGKVSDESLKSLRDVGLGDEEIVEVLGITGMMTIANYVSNVGQLDADFPEVSAV